VEEAVVAATAGGARALAVPDRGTIEVGRRADLVAWEAEHEGAFAWDLGLAPRWVVHGGQARGVATVATDATGEGPP